MRDLVSLREKVNHYDVAHVTIKGKTPLLMNQYVPGRQNDAKKQTLKKKVYSPEEDAAKSAYLAEIDGAQQLFIPSLCVYTMIVQACSGKKIPNPQGGRAIAAKGIIAGSLKIAPDKIPLGTDKYDIDVRRARIGTAAIDRARAVLPAWEASFDIVYDSDLIKSPEVFLEILDDAGDRLGLLDYRPQHMGPFGTFTVTKFEVPE